MSETAVLVGSGSFLVDHRRALEKLSQFQLPDPDLFLVPCIRAAVAGGATFITIDSDDSALVRMRFDGRPFSKEELEDPFGSLFGKNRHDTVRNRHMAIGILSALRLSPVHVLLSSGAPPNRFGLKIRSLAADIQVDPRAHDEYAGSEVIIQAHERQRRLLDGRIDVTDKIRELCAMSPIPIRISGTAIPCYRSSPPHSGAYVALKEGSVEGWAAVPEMGAGSTIRAHTLGVFVESFDLSTISDSSSMPIPLESCINDDGFTLNASHSAVVRNHRYRNALAVVGRQTQALILKSIEDIKTGSARIWNDLRDEAILQEWNAVWTDDQTVMGLLRRGKLFQFNLSDLIRRPTELFERFSPRKKTALIQFIRNLYWLRCACRKMLPMDGTDPQDDVQRALRTAPLIFSVTLTPLSLHDLEQERRRLGYVPFSRRPEYSAKSLPFNILWAPNDADLGFVRTFFQTHMRDVGPEMDKIVAGSKWAGVSPASLDGFGAKELLIRSAFKHEQMEGEVGLTVLPWDKGEIRFYREGRPTWTRTCESGLRFVAAVGHPALNAHMADIATSVSSAVTRQAEKRILEVACDLYPKLIAEYDRWTPTSRQRAIRDHLFDFIRFSHSPQNLTERKYSWIASTPLFRSRNGQCETIDQIHSRLSAGESVAYRFYSNTASPDMDLILDVQELELFESLWPDKKSQFVDLELGRRPPRAEDGRGRSEESSKPVVAPPAQPAPVLEARPTDQDNTLAGRKLRRRKPPESKGSVTVLLRGLFNRLKGRHGLKVSDAGVRSIELTDRPAGREILPKFDQKSWTLNRSHPMVRAVLAAPIPPEAQKDYLASILYTAVNRKLSGITDQDDVAFQEALVDALMVPDEPAGSAAPRPQVPASPTPADPSQR